MNKNVYFSLIGQRYTLNKACEELLKDIGDLEHKYKVSKGSDSAIIKKRHDIEYDRYYSLLAARNKIVDEIAEYKKIHSIDDSFSKLLDDSIESRLEKLYSSKESLSGSYDNKSYSIHEKKSGYDAYIDLVQHYSKLDKECFKKKEQLDSIRERIKDVSNYDEEFANSLVIQYRVIQKVYESYTDALEKLKNVKETYEKGKTQGLVNSSRINIQNTITEIDNIFSDPKFKSSLMQAQEMADEIVKHSEYENSGFDFFEDVKSQKKDIALEKAALTEMEDWLKNYKFKKHQGIQSLDDAINDSSRGSR